MWWHRWHEFVFTNSVTPAITFFAFIFRPMTHDVTIFSTFFIHRWYASTWWHHIFTIHIVRMIMILTTKMSWFAASFSLFAGWCDFFPIHWWFHLITVMHPTWAFALWFVWCFTIPVSMTTWKATRHTHIIRQTHIIGHTHIIRHTHIVGHNRHYWQFRFFTAIERILISI